MDRRVSVFVCGVQKAGTTSLHAHFCEHPDLSPPRHKETHFFDFEEMDWDMVDYRLLHDLYSSDDGRRRRFDITPIYSFWPPSMARIHVYNPDARIIVVFRDPFERAYSQWSMEYARGDETLPFDAAIREGRQRLRGLPLLARPQRIYSYLERGFYADHVRRILAHFPRDQALFLRAEDLRDAHVRTLSVIASFLGIAEFPQSGPKREHGRPELAIDSKPTAADLALFRAALRDEMLAFSDLSGIDVSGWPTVRA